MVGMRKRSASPESEESSGGPVSRLRDARLIASGVAGILLLWFALDNRRNVSIEFWVKSSHAPLILVIGISGLLGALITALALRRKPPRE
jgi:uncharacterized integral membrane protein